MNSPDATSNLVRRHLRWGWWLLLVYLALGIALEVMHGFKVGYYLSVANETRRLMWRLAHTHGALLGLVHIAFAVTVKLAPRDGEPAWRSWASKSLTVGALLMPLGFVLGGVIVYESDPWIGVLLVPVGALFLLVAVGSRSTRRADSSSMTGMPNRGRARAALVPLAAFLAVAFGFHAWLEFRGAGMHGVDGYFHTKLAHLYATGEVMPWARHFRWMSYSAINDLRCDWQLGYHLMLVPFTWFGLLLGGKLSTALFAALIPTVVFGILRAERVRFAWAFAALLLVSAEYYLVRIHLPRPTSPVVALLLVSSYFAARGRLRPLFLCLLAMLLIYAVPHNVVALLVVAAVATRIADGALRPSLVFTVVAALLVGTLSHPGFWQWRGSFFGTDHALFNLWRQLSGTLEAAENGDRIRIGGEWVVMHAPAEFLSLELRQILEQFVGPLIVFACAVVLGLVAMRERREAVWLTMCGMAAAYFVLFLQHVRFAEYWIPFTALAAGLCAQRVLEAGARRTAGIVLAVVLGGAALVPGVGAVRAAADTLESDAGIGLEYERPMRWLEENTPRDSIVFHARWPQFCPMFFFNDHNRYIVGLDSYFLYQHDSERYRRWMQITLGELDPSSTRDAILEFDSRHVLVKRGIPLDLLLQRAPATLPMYEDATFRVYELR